MKTRLTWAASAVALVTATLVLTGLLDLREAASIAIAVELLLVMTVSVTAITGLRAFRRQRAQGAAPWSALVATVPDVLPGPLAALVLHEATIIRSLWLAVRRTDDGVGPQDVAFGYTAGQGLTTGALATVATVELAVVHLLVPWQWARTLLLVVGVWSMVLVLGAWAGRRHHPHVVSADHLLLRAGPHTLVEIPWSALSVVRRVTQHEPTSVTAIGQRLHLPVDGTTRLLAELTEPLTARLPFGRTAQIDSIAFSGDDPAALHDAVLGAWQTEPAPTRRSAPRTRND